MRRTIPLVVMATWIVWACGSDGTRTSPSPTSTKPHTSLTVNLTVANTQWNSAVPEDFLISNSRDFSALLIEKKIPHEFRELPGTHSWPYWDRQVQEILKLAAQKLAAPADDSKQKAKGAGVH